MNTTNKILIGAVGLGILLWGVSYYVQQTEKESRLIIENRIVAQEKTMLALAELTDQNRSDSLTAGIVSDCSTEEREQFDDYLNRLAGLTQVQMTDAERLFAICAGFQANQKAVMAARLQRELEVYQDYIELHSLFDSRGAVTQYDVDRWQQLVALEQRRSEILNRQLELQAEIITFLKEGVAPASEEVQANLSEAREIKESFGVFDAQIDALRADLSDV